jgi:glycosyltransferase involved in cell wall biosynthesis
LSKHARVSVVAATASASSVRDEGAVKVHRFMVGRWPLSLLRPHNPADWWAIYATLRDGRTTLQNIVENGRPDYILALWALPSGYWARDMLKRYGIPYGVWALGSDIWGLGRIPILRSFLRVILNDADRCFADGLKLADDVKELSGKPCDFLPSSRLLANGDARDVAAAPPYRLAFLGRWHYNKGIDILMDALTLLSDDDWKKITEFRIHGGGPLSAEVHKTASKLRALGRPVEVGGYLDKGHAAKLIAWADYMTIPSRIESIPVIFSDAAQLRRPMIAAPVGDLPNLIGEHQCGVIAAAAGRAEFADAIRQAIGVNALSFLPGLKSVGPRLNVAESAQQVAERIKSIASRS